MGVHTPGKPSALNPRLQMTYKRMLKIERIARLTLDPSGFSNAQIANMLNCHQQTVVLVRQLPEFHAKVMELSCGVLSSYDAQLRANIDNARQELRDMVPTAMNVIKAAALGKLGAQLQYKAATDILDREGNLARPWSHGVVVQILSGVNDHRCQYARPCHPRQVVPDNQAPPVVLSADDS